MVASLSLGLGGLLAGRGMAQGGEPVVETVHGKVAGRATSGGLAFKGIPYGAPTTGRARFCRPGAVTPWSGVRDGGAFGAPAPQLSHRISGATGRLPPNEDCLFLNVFTPSADAHARRPVMVWLHGGGWRVGSGNVEAMRLAQIGDVVVVSINHRLTLFGHLMLENHEERFADSANVGILDMIAALKWVQENVARFGGDPGNVTIFGQSGGGSKVTALMAAPAAEGLFHKAIAQSCSGALRNATQEEAHRSAARLAQVLDLSKATGEALQAISMDRLLAALKIAAPEVNAYRPVLDGRTFTRHPFDPDAPKLSAHIPFMAGNAATETTAELSHDRANFFLDADEVRRRLERYLPASPAKVQAIIEAYGGAIPKASPSDILVAVTTDYQYIRNTRRAALLQATGGRAPVYSYVFDWRTPAMDGLLKSPHAAELPFIFGTFSADLPQGEALSRRMIMTWSSFARTGNPNNAEIPDWPQFEAGQRSTMMLNLSSRVERDPGGRVRAVLDDLPYYEYNMPIDFDEPAPPT